MAYTVPGTATHQLLSSHMATLEKIATERQVCSTAHQTRAGTSLVIAGKHAHISLPRATCWAILAAVLSPVDRAEACSVTFWQAALLASLDEDSSAPATAAVASAKGKPKKKGKRAKGATAAVSVAAFPATPSSQPASPAPRRQEGAPIASQQASYPRTSAGRTAATEQGSAARKPPSGQPHSSAACEPPQHGAPAQHAAGREGDPGAVDPQESGWVRVVKGSGSRRCADQGRDARAMI